MMIFTTKRLNLLIYPLNFLDKSLLHCLLFTLLLLLELWSFANHNFWCLFYLLTHQHSFSFNLFSFFFFFFELFIKHTHNFLAIDSFVYFWMNDLQFSCFILFDCFLSDHFLWLFCFWFHGFERSQASEWIIMVHLRFLRWLRILRFRLIHWFL